MTVVRQKTHKERVSRLNSLYDGLKERLFRCRHRCIGRTNIEVELTDEFQPLMGGQGREVKLSSDAVRIVEYKSSSGNQIRCHWHQYDVTFMVLSGKVIFETSVEKVEIRSGHIFCIPANRSHFCRFKDDSHLLLTFNPKQDKIPDSASVDGYPGKTTDDETITHSHSDLYKGFSV